MAFQQWKENQERWIATEHVRRNGRGMSILSQAAARLQVIMDQPLPEVQPLPPPGSEFVIYGAGSCGRDAMRVLLERGYRVLAFLDVRANSKSPCGLTLDML